MPPWCVWLLVVVAGPLWVGDAWAGDAWMGEYRIRDAQGERELILVRDDTRIEYRVPGQPVRVWRRTADGIELRELYVGDKRMVVYEPGDLRALAYAPDWTQLSGLVDPALRARLTEKGKASALGRPIVRYRGADAQGARIELDWLPEADMPMRLAMGKSRAGDAIRLQRLERIPAERAFSAIDGLLELDHADLGDMELDPFVRSLSHADHAAH